MAKASVHAEAAVMLREARLHIEKMGWAKGAWSTPTGAVCLLQALKDVDGTKHGKDVDAEAKRIVLNLTGTTDIPSWNDATKTTKERVLELLLAAEQCEKELAS